jgi:serine/threonine protein kinase
MLSDDVRGRPTQVDELVERFEQAWKSAASQLDWPRIEEFLGSAEPADRAAVVFKLVALDRAYRERAGQPARAAEYAARFAECAQLEHGVPTASIEPGRIGNDRPGEFPWPTRSTPDTACESDVEQLNTALRPRDGSAPRYVALEKVGEGGMGAVFKADQRAARPGDIHHRDVALKVIPLGMNSKQVVARFGAERQALALMSHPNIATVFDAGVLADGRPFFAMEYVPGRPITEFADANRLGIEARLRLFQQVCDAIQHAHAKGVIHRDLKPTNVLTYMDGASPRAKVIDFGVAKAVGGRLTELTINTAFDGAVGTLAYMSPEQAAGDPDIDVRTDVYALGVLLYELLAGVNPFDFKRLAEDEIRRVIRETDPPKPDTRLSGLGADRASEVSKGRGVPVSELRARLAGELGWIPLRAMRKSRAERYETVPQLRADVERYLTARPLAAGPDSAAYRLRKYLRRHRGPVAAATALVLLLVAGTAGSVTGWARALARAEGERRARADADQQRIQSEARLQVAEERTAASLVSEGDAYLPNARVMEARSRYGEAWAMYERLGLPTLPARLGLWDAERVQASPCWSFEGHGEWVNAARSRRTGGRSSPRAETIVAA